MSLLESFSDEWPSHIHEGNVIIADGKKEFMEEMEEHNESFDDVLLYHVAFEEKLPNRPQMVHAAWTKKRVYFPVGECCYFVESVPIPEKLQWH